MSVPYPPHPTVCRLYGRSMLHVRKCQVPLSPPFQHSLYHKVPSFLLSSNSYLPMLMPLLVLYTPISHILPLIVLHTPISHILMPFLDIWVSSYIAYVFFSFFLKGGRGRSSPTHSNMRFRGLEIFKSEKLRILRFRGLEIFKVYKTFLQHCLDVSLSHFSNYGAMVYAYKIPPRFELVTGTSVQP